MKRFYSFIILLVFVLALGACSSGNSEEVNQNNDSQGNNDSEVNESNDDVIELRMAWWGGQERHDHTLKVIELYEEQNDHIKIVPEYSGMDGYFDKLTTQFAGGNAPDIIQYGGNLNDFVYRDVVLPLDEYVGNELDMSLHDQNMIDAATFDDQFYGVTLGTNAWGVLLNKSLFDEAGVSLPSRDWTWDEFIEIASQLTESLDGVAGTEYFAEDGFGLYIDQNGKVLHEDGVLGIEKQDLVDWFTLWEDIRETGAVVSPEIQAASSTTPEQSMIIQGDVAMQLVASNQYGAYSNASQDEFILHNFPYNESGSHGTSLRASQFLAGYSETEHPEEVAKFLDFFTNNKEATAILGNDRGAPVNSEVRENLIASANEVDEVIFEFIDFVSSTSNTPFVPNLPGYNETQALFKATSEDIAFGIVSIEEGTDIYWEELLESLEKNKPE